MQFFFTYKDYGNHPITIYDGKCDRCKWLPESLIKGLLVYLVRELVNQLLI